MDLTSTITLNNGIKIPRLGLGTWLSNGKACEHAVTFALDHGYTLIDTAQAYENEKQVGRGWKASGKAREAISITTKIGNTNQGYNRAKRSFEKSLKNLQTDYVDLLLIHWPNSRKFNETVETWRAMVGLQEAGLCRAIGVSNFTIPLLEELYRQIDVVPAANQVEFHPFLYQKELLVYCQEHQIQIEAYSPLARVKFLDNPVLETVAQKHGKSPAQVMLAWGLHRQLVVIPKSTHETRILENTDVFFALDEADLTALDRLDRGYRLVKGAWAPPTW